ncbi:hypothetical protein [Chryseobacterium sp. RR2-3-20]|uniref:hypothetical protein n=1 Tax=Chryseobacterium sp. RR2-3-20 TaxID=2787626 RepID=UPI001ADF0FA7|nr:hypothetical protein [Chryseobacterium sp. RR2-3-20]
MEKKSLAFLSKKESTIVYAILYFLFFFSSLSVNANTTSKKDSLFISSGQSVIYVQAGTVTKIQQEADFKNKKPVEIYISSGTLVYNGSLLHNSLLIYRKNKLQNKPFKKITSKKEYAKKTNSKHKELPKESRLYYNKNNSCIQYFFQQDSQSVVVIVDNYRIHLLAVFAKITSKKSFTYLHKNTNYTYNSSFNLRPDWTHFSIRPPPLM